MVCPVYYFKVPGAVIDSEILLSLVLGVIRLFSLPSIGINVSVSISTAMKSTGVVLLVVLDTITTVPLGISNPSSGLLSLGIKLTSLPALLATTRLMAYTPVGLGLITEKTR